MGGREKTVPKNMHEKITRRKVNSVQRINKPDILIGQ